MPGFEVIGSEEFSQVKEVFDNGGVLFRHSFDHLRNKVFKVEEFERAFADHHSAKYALAVSSGTAALRVALASLNIGENDEVVTQAFTFVATVEAIIESGAVPVCTEVDETLNMDPSSLLDCITDRTKAVIVVHMLGIPARLKEIKKICDERGISLIEDTAWGCGGALQEKSLGTWGTIGTFSFDYAKTMTTGEGGMLLFQEEQNYLTAKAWHDHGHENNPLVPRWEDTRSSSGFNFRMMELQGAIGLAQLKKLKDIVLAQRNNAIKIWNSISDISGVSLRMVPENAFETYDALVFFVDNAQIAIKCRQKLVAAGVGTKILPEATTWHFAAHWSHMKQLENSSKVPLLQRFPKSEKLLSRAVSIPIGVSFDESKLSSIRDSIIAATKSD